MGSNFVPTHGGDGLNRIADEGEPMLNADWRSQLQASSRHRIVNKIMETLKRHLPFSGQEGLQELKKIAVRFEEKIYSAANSQSDYLRKISLKMLTMETKSSQNPLPNPLASNSALNNNRFPVPGVPQVQNLNQPAPLRASTDQQKEQLLEQVKKQKVELVNLKQTLMQLQVQQQNLLRPTQQQPSQQSGKDSNSVPTLAPYCRHDLNRTADEGEPMLNGDWRGQLQAGSRQRIVDKIVETLNRHLPVSCEEGLQELKKIAMRFEEKIYSAATDQTDYLRKISNKMLTMEIKSSQVPQSTLPRVQNLNQPAPLQQKEQQLLEQVKKQKVELVSLKQTLQVQQEDLSRPSQQSGMQPSSTESSSPPLSVQQSN